jgi:hypothetical protein
VGSVSSSKSYIVRFSAQSTKDTVFSVYLRQSGSPFTIVSETQTFKVGPTRQEYEFLFQGPQNQSNAVLVFVTRGKNFRFWLDNVSLQEANVSLLDLDKQIRFECNTTASTRTIALDAAYVDVRNKKHSGSISLAPYSSIILLRDGDKVPSAGSLQFKQASYTSELNQRDQRSIAEFLSSSDGKKIDAQLNANEKNGEVPKWLKINGRAIDGIALHTGSKVEFGIDASGLAPGNYVAQITAKAENYTSASISIKLTVKPYAAPTSLRVNFQDEGSTPPAGWLADFGQAYGVRRSANQGTGRTYGWIGRADGKPLDLTQNGRNRNAPSEVLNATLMHIQARDAAHGVWEAKVPNGSYDVTVSAGDNAFLDSRHTINIEGVPAIVNFVPRRNSRFRTATVRVDVKDGRLTVNADGGTNTKINYIIIESSTTTAAPTAHSTLPALAEETSFVEAAAAEAETSTASLRIGNVFPNPSTNYFNINILGSNQALVDLFIADMSGRIVETRAGIAANSTIQVGHRLPPGAYVVRVRQGSQYQESKMIKL